MVSIAMWIFPCSGAFPSIHLVRSEYHMQMATTMTRLVCKPKVTWFHVRTTWVLPGPRITRKVVEKNALFPFKLTIIYLWLGAMLIGNLITSLVRLHVETPQFRVCVYIYRYILNKYIYIYIYMHIYIYIWAISKTLGSRKKGHPQIWKGPIAYHTFVQ